MGGTQAEKRSSREEITVRKIRMLEVTTSITLLILGKETETQRGSLDPQGHTLDIGKPRPSVP